MKLWLLQQLKKRKRVYVMPTKMGGYLLGLIFLLFLLSIGYSNNLLLIFTLVLFALNLIWVLQTHFHLNQLKFLQVKIQNGHVEAPVKIKVRWNNAFKLGHCACEIQTAKETFSVQSLQNFEQHSDGEVVLPYRGQFDWKYLKVSTDWPFGLYQVWIYYPLSETSLAYPALLKNQSLDSLEALEAEGESPSPLHGPEGFQDLGPYQNDESRRISWKHYARSGEVLIKLGESTRQDLLRVTLNLPTNEKLKEQYLSEVATMLSEAHDRQIPFILLGRKQYGPGHHPGLLQDCLKELALA